MVGVPRLDGSSDAPPTVVSVSAHTFSIVFAIKMAARPAGLDQGVDGYRSVSRPPLPLLVSENVTCSVPALKGCEGLWSYDYGHA